MSVIQADALRIPLADASVHMCVTSPPYWGLRDYGVGGQLGLEATPDEFVANLVSVFREVWRVLRDDGTLWLNLGDSYGHGTSAARQQSRTSTKVSESQHKAQGGRHGEMAKQLMGIPWRVAFALQADGWWLRNDIIWSKPNPMPESATDRCTKSHDYLFLLAKRERYYFDNEAIKEPAAVGWNDSSFNDARDMAMHPTTQLRPPASATFKRNGSKREAPIVGQGYGTHRPDRDDTLPNGYRNRRTVWEIPTAPYSGAHFATFPPALVEPCILAGTSAAGVCAVCGAPWERVTETDNPRASDEYRQRKTTPKDEAANGIGGRGTHTSGLAKPGWRKDGRATTETLGWRPTCAHDASTVPATVLDPFAGSGTTGAVARLHGRRFVGLDINGHYLRDFALPRAEGRQTAASLATLPMFARAGGG